jgi:hypothetical protein
MDAGAVLDIHFITDAYKIYISTNDRIKPDAAIITHYHIANDSGIGSNKSISAKLRVFIFYGKY